MRSRLVVTAVALTVGGLVTTPALGQPVACKLVVDPVGDDAAGTGVSDTLDIVSADVATDRRTLTAVVRVSELDESEATAATGQRYSFEFASGTTRFRLEAHRTNTGEYFSGSVHGEFTGVDGAGHSRMTSMGEFTGVFDADASEVRIHVPIAAMRVFAARAGSDRLTGLAATSYRNVGEAGAGTGIRTASTAVPADHATGDATYTPGSASCVRVGR